MKVLICIDGSQHSELALAQSTDAHWPADSKFRVVSVIDDNGDGKRQQAAEQLVNQAASQLRSKIPNSIEAEGLVLKGYAKGEVLSFVEKWKPDLLVVGSRGRKGLKRVLLGSVSHSLLLTADCSVQIVRGRATQGTSNKKVLISLDDSEYSKLVINQITSRPWPAGTEFLCVTAVPSLAEMVHEDQNSHSISFLQEHRNEDVALTQRFLERTTRTIQDRVKDATCTWEILEGDPREAVVDKAEKWKANLIMTGCRGKHLIDRILIGSVSEAIATWADCSVEVVKR